MCKCKYDSIFNNGHTPMLIINSETGEIRDGNHAACNYYGYTLDKLLTLKITDINTLNQQEVFEEMKRAKQEDRKFFRFKHRLASGEIKEVEVYSGPVIDGDEPLLFSIIHDVEDKLAMERKIKLQESYFQSLYENSPEAIAMLDEEFRVISINSSFERIFQYGIEEIRHKDITEVLCEEQFYDESTYFKDSIERGEFVRKETLRKRKDGKPIHVSFLGYPIISNGKQIGVYGIYSDLSEIMKEKQKAEENSRFKSQFIANMTHELRTPMNGIVGIIELLADTRLSEEQKEYLQMLGYSANRLSAIINDVLDISKIEAGRLELRNVRFNMKKLVNDAARYFKIQAGRKGLDLNCHVDSEIPDFLMGDPDKLNQILFNLLSNAVKFTDNGCIDIYVKQVNGDADKVSLDFGVKDTGIGIPKEMLGRIFEDFFQLETIKDRKYNGTGLGLSIARRLVRLMGGDILAVSESNRGCTFSFTIPFIVATFKDLQEINGLQYKGGSSGALPAIDILVVEDDMINQKILKSLLEKSRCNVTLAANGKDALKILERRVFDIILMDIYMPEMNGCDAARVIRDKESGTGRYTPIIALTAAAQDEEREKYLEAGIDDCIAKPCGRNRIYNAIAGVLKSRHKIKGFSLESFIDRLEGDYELAKDVIGEFTSPDYEAELFGGIEKYLSEKDLEGLGVHIHKFKGSMSHFKVDSLNQILYDIKENCKSHNLYEMERLCGSLKQEYMQLKEYLISCSIGEE